MENRSTLGTFVKGFAFSAFSGALLIGIMAGVSLLAAPLGIGISAMTLGQVLPMALLTATSAGLLGGIMRVMTGGAHQSPRNVAYSMANPRDIAITSVSQNLAQPQMQAALHGHRGAGDQELVQEPPHFRERVGQKPSAIERANAILARHGQGPQSHAERVQLSRATTPGEGLTH
jgi:hypothetical protein